MTQVRIWIVCSPNAQTAVNTALAAIHPSLATTMVVAFPQGTELFGAPPTPKFYYAGGQGNLAEMQAIENALSGVTDVRVFLGSVVGEDNENDAQDDHTQGSINTTKYTRRAAFRASAEAMGIVVNVR